MEKNDSGRRLAAILFTDIAGYTTMMQRDEGTAMVAVRRHHAVLQACVPAHHGEIQQYYGDGSLSTFNSATDAVRCALEFQKQVLQAPEVPVRLGIHIGEIHTEDGKIFGDGVNLAARIESIGQPGTVLFSRHVYEKVRNHPEFQIKVLGTFEFKNVDDPIEVYALANPEIRMPDSKHIEGKLKEKQTARHKSLWYALSTVIFVALILGIYFLPHEGRTSPSGYTNSVAVLQFENRSRDSEQDFLSIGIPEDILTELAQIQGLKVISRSSSMMFQDPDKSNRTWKEIAADLGVEHLLAGSVMKIGANLHVNVKLIDATQESIIWAEKYTRSFEDVLSVQQEIATRVSEKLKVALAPHMIERFENPVSVHAEAYVTYLKGQEALLRSSGSPAEVGQAIAYFEKAVSLDSGFAKAWVGLADAHLESIFWHRTTDGIGLPNATRAAIAALKLDPKLGEGYAALGAVDLYSHNLEEAESNLEKALALNPNCVFAHERLAWLHLYTGRKVEAFEGLEKAIELDPLSTRLKGGLVNAYYFTKKYDQGLAKTREYLAQHPKDNFILWASAYLLAGKGSYQEAIDTLDQRTLGRGTNWVYAYCYAHLGQQELAQTILDTLLARDARGFVPDFMIAVACAAIGEKQEAINHLEQAIGRGGESFFAWGIGSDPMFSSLRGEPRFQAIVESVEVLFND